MNAASLGSEHPGGGVGGGGGLGGGEVAAAGQITGRLMHLREARARAARRAQNAQSCTHDFRRTKFLMTLITLVFGKPGLSLVLQ